LSRPTVNCSINAETDVLSFCHNFIYNWVVKLEITKSRIINKPQPLNHRYHQTSMFSIVSVLQQIGADH
jgi:hypothetical protein